MRTVLLTAVLLLLYAARLRAQDHPPGTALRLNAPRLIWHAAEMQYERFSRKTPLSYSVLGGYQKFETFNGYAPGRLAFAFSAGAELHLNLLELQKGREILHENLYVRSAYLGLYSRYHYLSETIPANRVYYDGGPHLEVHRVSGGLILGIDILISRHISLDFYLGAGTKKFSDPKYEVFNRVNLMDSMRNVNTRPGPPYYYRYQSGIDGIGGVRVGILF